nr:amidohydrolase family protein [Arthrobacter sp. ISL-72]
MNPELIILADTIHTMEGWAGSPAPQAVAVQDGVIAAVGSRSDAESWSAAEVVDFGAAVLTPGLVDCHIHPVFGLELTRGCDLSGVAGLAEVRALLRAEAAATPSGEWVRGWGLDPNVFGTASAHRELIDDVVSGHPCLIRLFDGHSALARFPGARNRRGHRGARSARLPGWCATGAAGLRDSCWRPPRWSSLRG